MKESKRVKIFCNDNEKSRKVKEKVIDKLALNDYEVVEDSFDIGIAIGGDGSFLRMVTNSNFNSNVCYIGINTGTLGFAQEVDANELDDFIYKLQNNLYKIEEIGIGEVLIESNESIHNFCILNDITIRDENLNTCRLDVFVDNHKLESFIGDGILISTSFGSTAYNLSFGGSIVYNTLHTLQITPIAPLNSKVYNCLRNSVVIPQYKEIEIKPDNSNLIVTIDGNNISYKNVSSIKISLNDKVIKCLRENDYNFINKVNDKFLK